MLHTDGMTFPSPIGVSDFKELRETHAYYVDKTDLIVELLDRKSKVVLYPRPRRFGKTLMMSTLRTFFEPSDEDRSWMFQDLAVWKSEQAREHYQKHPVIDLSFRGLKLSSWEKMFAAIRGLLAREFERHDYLLDSLTPAQVRVFESVINETADFVRLARSLGDLSRWLEEFHGSKPVVLLDEYDVPIQASWVEGFYEEAMEFFRMFVGLTFKDNVHLYRGVLTGVLRVSKESMFSDANNVDVFSTLQRAYATSFGFTQAEVDEIVSQLGVSHTEAEQVKQWYDGYRFGGHVIYNPWSVLKYAANVEDGPQAYWIFTGADNVLRKLVLGRWSDVTEDLKTLMTGGTLEREVTDTMVLRELDTNPDAVWNLLLMSGYLTTREVKNVDGKMMAQLAVPNQEVRAMFERNIVQWSESVTPQGRRGLRHLFNAMFQGNEEEFGARLGEIVRRSFSYHDLGDNEPERVYQAFVLGMMVQLRDDYYVKSNRESGYGRYDVALIPNKPGNPGVVFEFKSIRPEQRSDKALDEAMDQLDALGYDTDLREAAASPVVKWGVVFDGKRVTVHSEVS